MGGRSCRPPRDAAERTAAGRLGPVGTHRERSVAGPFREDGGIHHHPGPADTCPGPPAVAAQCLAQQVPDRRIRASAPPRQAAAGPFGQCAHWAPGQGLRRGDSARPVPTALHRDPNLPDHAAARPAVADGAGAGRVVVLLAAASRSSCSSSEASRRCRALVCTLATVASPTCDDRLPPHVRRTMQQSTPFECSTVVISGRHAS